MGERYETKAIVRYTRASGIRDPKATLSFELSTNEYIGDAVHFNLTIDYISRLYLMQPTVACVQYHE